MHAVVMRVIRLTLLFDSRSMVGDDLPAVSTENPCCCVAFGYVERHALVDAFVSDSPGLDGAIVPDDPNLLI